MALKPGPMQVVHNFFTSKSEVFADLDKLDLWPTTYVSDRMQELPLHWHDVDNCGYVLEGSSYVLNEHGERIPLGPGDKLIIPAGALHAERSCDCWIRRTAPSTSADAASRGLGTDPRCTNV